MKDTKEIIQANGVMVGSMAKDVEYAKILSDIGASKALVVLSKNNEQLNKASKNLKECDVLTINSMNPSVLINADKVVVTSETINSLTEVLS